MKKIFQRIDCIRASGMATLNLDSSSPYYHLNGNRYAVINIGKPEIKCLVTLNIDDELVAFTIEELF